MNYTSALARYTNQPMSTNRVSLIHAPSQGSLELSSTQYNTNHSRRSHVASHSTMRTMNSPMDCMGQKTAEKWFDSHTRIFQKINEEEDDIPFYEVMQKRRKVE